MSVVVAGGDRLSPLPTRVGRAGALVALSKVYDTPRSDSAPDESADLAAALDWVHRTKRRRGLVVVASDFLDRSRWADAMRRVALRHRVVGVHITDPRELQLAPVGVLSLIDAESGRRVHVQTRSATLRARYAEAAANRQERIASDIRRAGGEYLHLSTDRDWVLDLARFVGARGRRP
jgi:uncharacterized protein (DUF58 family)